MPLIGNTETDLPKPRKSLGQHFLISEAVCARIVNILSPHAEDNILEIGPGPGALTRVLASSPHRRLLLLEKDSYWACQRQKSSSEAPLQTILTDALDFSWNKLCALGNWKIIGNLPYNIASPLVWNISAQCVCLICAVVMVQKEVAQRICAKPDSKTYGALSVWVQSHLQPHMEFTLGPGYFRPPPKVDSAVISLKPLAQDKKTKYPAQLKHILQTCFQNRRKQLGTIFRKANLEFMATALPALGIRPDLRPENLSCHDFEKLAEYYAMSRHPNLRHTS